MTEKYNFKEDLIRRIRDNKPSRFIRFGIVSLIFFAWVIWLGTWWVGLFWFLLADIYITGFIPLTWWKKSKSAATRTVMSWVDAIVYAVVVVYFVFAFIGQNYQIPSASLEKTLLTGDYLWVNKVIYGPRVPMTPVHFPLVHNKLPIFNCDSYLDSPKLPYHRLKGIRSIELGDIVVFNFPAGDTVATKFEDTPNYYDLLVKQYSREYIAAHPEIFGEIKFRPVDRRQNFVKRCVGLPGQRFKIVNDTIYNDDVAMPTPENAQFTYIVASDKPLDPEYLYNLGVTADDVRSQFEPIELTYICQVLPEAATSRWLYVLPLTDGMLSTLTKDGYAKTYTKASEVYGSYNLFPDKLSEEWTLSNYGGDGIIIPAKGMTIDLTPENWWLYERCIRNYEGHSDAFIDANNKVHIDGKIADTYTFDMDYYFMMGDNRDLSQDSRFWGFVPEDHIVGSPAIVLISFDRDRSIFNGGIRWNRILRDANPDK